MSHDAAMQGSEQPSTAADHGIPGFQLPPGIEGAPNADSLLALVEGVQRHVQVLASLRAQQDVAASTLSQREKELETRQNSLAELENQARTALQNAEEATARAEQARQELQERERVLSERARQIEEREGAVGGRAAELERAAAELESRRAEVDALQQRSGELEARAATLNIQAEEAMTRAEQARRELDARNQAFEELTKQVAERDRARTAEIDALRGELDARRGEADSMRSRIAELDAAAGRVVELQGMVENREGQLAEVAIRLQGAQLDAQTAREEAHHARQELAALQASHNADAALQQQLDKAREELQQASAKAETMGFRVAELEQELGKLAAAHATALSDAESKTLEAQYKAEEAQAQVQEALTRAKAAEASAAEALAHAVKVEADAALHTDVPDLALGKEWSDRRRRRLEAVRRGLQEQAFKIGQAKRALAEQIAQARANGGDSEASAAQLAEIETLRKQLNEAQARTEGQRLQLEQWREKLDLERDQLAQERAEMVRERAEMAAPSLEGAIEADELDPKPKTAGNSPLKSLMYAGFLAAGLTVAVTASWWLASRIAQPMCVATMTLGIDNRNEQPTAEQTQQWQEYVKGLPDDPRLADRAAERFKARGFEELSTATGFTEKLRGAVDVDTTQPGTVKLSMKYQGFDRCALALDTLGTTMLGMANDSRDIRADHASTLVATVAQTAGEPIEDPRVAVFGAIAGALTAVTLFGAALAYRKMKGGAPARQPKPAPIPAAIPSAAAMAHNPSLVARAPGAAAPRQTLRSLDQ